MDAPIPAIWTTGSTEVFKTGTWRASLPQHIEAPAPCHAACPVNGNVAEWIGRVRAGDFRGAWEALTRHNPFPALAGRVCHHPCEAACNRGGFDEALAICRLERFVGDLALAERWAFSGNAPRRNERIAIVGGGPSGLAAAFHLRRCGYAVTLYESQPELGGLMRYGIPAYRLSRQALDGEISRIVALGVDVRCGQEMATPADFAWLRAEYDAVYLAIGARRPKRLPVLDYTRPWVIDGATYLARANSGKPLALGRRVVVIGGGSAALDAARSARRAGHAVTILALESAAQMPAQHEEVAEALEEGVALVDGAQLTTVGEEHAAGLQLGCTRVRFESGVARGESMVTPVAGGEFTLEADAIVTSIGQDPELAPVAGALATAGGLIQVDAEQSTTVPGIYAGGDVASMARFVTEAIGMGNRAARSIDRALRACAADECVPQSAAQSIVSLGNIATFYYPLRRRAAEGRLDAAQRLTTDAEVQLVFGLDQALAEAGRCFSCGTCVFCDNCVQFCPDLAIQRVNQNGADRYTVLTDYCKGCGVCVKECPTGSMKMVEEAR